MSYQIKTRTALIVFLFTIMLQSKSAAQDISPVMSWDFSKISHRTTIEPQSGIVDTLEGNFSTAPGISGQGLRLDGFTTRIIRKGKDLKNPGSEFTIEAWVALGEYPLNWCPVITTESDEVKGYRLQIGPYGQVSFETAISEKWISCVSADKTIPLRKWTYLVGVYKAQKELVLYVNGKLVSTVAIKGSLTNPKKTNCILGMVTVPKRPSNTIRTWGTVPTFFGLDGIIDEVKVFDKAFTADQVKYNFSKIKVTAPDIQPRRLPVVKNPGHFGAYYTKLKYYPAWDNLWPVDKDPDIVVFFDKNPSKLIFWRGTRYGPSWVSENENWMADQSLETWGTGKNDIEGCFEHMQDRHCRFSHVRMIENNEARAVVHWRYAPVSSHDHTWKPDPKTGWECWVDEYYYIYPDGSAIRKVSWNKGSAGRPVQFQESLPITQPGQRTVDLLEDNYVTVADYDYNTCSVSRDENKKPSDWKRDYTIQQYNFKSINKPYICFEPGNRMSVRWIGGGYNHFPVNQARCDGRWAKTLDRPTHIMSSPCSYPVIHENGNRLYWFALYGMNSMVMDELVSFGRSWAYAPGLKVISQGFESEGYDMSERAYKLKRMDKSQQLRLIIMADNTHPLINPAFVITSWGKSKSKMEVRLNDKILKEGDDYFVGWRSLLTGLDMILFIKTNQEDKTEISIKYY